MRILDYALAFVVAFSIVFSAAHILSGTSPAQQAGAFIAGAALADEAPSEPIDFSKLVRIDGRDFEVQAGPNVRTEALSSATITKIAYGQVRRINVVRTPSGSYSSDGLVSPHIKYAGITVRERTAETGGGAFWQSGRGWLPLPDSGQSFTWTYGAGYFSTGERTCLYGQGYLTCN